MLDNIWDYFFICCSVCILVHTVQLLFSEALDTGDGCRISERGVGAT